LRSDYHGGTTWAPAGETPVVAKTSRRCSVNMISAVTACGDGRFMVHHGTDNGRVFKTFLQWLVVDGHPAHPTRRMRDYVASTETRRDRLIAPKRDLAKRDTDSLEQMKHPAIGALRRIQKRPDLVRAFFHHPQCRYVLD
jgi:hypothetical protein